MAAHTYKNIPHIFEATIVPAGELTGKEWEVVIIGPDGPDGLVTHDGREYIPSKNGRLYDVAAVAEAAGMFEGVKVYDDHLTKEEFQARGGMRSPAREWLGTITNVAWEATTRQLKGVFKVVDQGLRDKLKNAYESGVLKSVGLSLDALIKQSSDVFVNGVSMPVVTGFPKVHSVDLVGDPAAGGGFVRAIAANNEVNRMSEMNGVNLDGLAAELAEVKGLVSELTKSLQPAAEAVADEDQEEEAEEVEETEAASDGQASEALKNIERQLFDMKVEKAIESAKLTGSFAQLARRGIRTARDIEPVIKQAKEAQAATDPTGRVAESGGVRGSKIEVGITGDELAEVGLMRLLMGNREFNNLDQTDSKDVKQRQTEAFKSWQKNGRPADNTRRLSEWAYNILGGNPYTDDRAWESVTQSSMSSIVKNSLNLMLANSYSKREEWWAPIVTEEEVDTIDQATLVRTYGVSSLSQVNEGNAYTELSWADDEETASFVKKGNYIGITLETMLNDKLNEVRQIPIRLANAWYNTLSDMVSGVFTVNSAAGPVLSDTGALFNATATTTGGGHANLLTTAFGTTSAAYAAARLAMQKQTDQALGAGRRLGITPKYILVPFDLETTAQAVINSEVVPGASNSQPNVFFRESQVIAVPTWTDATDWALVGDPMQFPAIYLIFLRGRRLPELFASDSETAGAMFTNDELRYKVRLMTWQFSSTYTCAPVADFRPLHKSNVA